MAWYRYFRDEIEKFAKKKTKLTEQEKARFGTKAKKDKETEERGKNFWEKTKKDKKEKKK